MTPQVAAWLLTLLVATACGGGAASGPRAPVAPAGGAPATTPEDDARATADQIGPCARYAHDVAGALARVEVAAEEFLVTVERARDAAHAGRAADTLAMRLEAERAVLGAVRGGEAELDAAHAALVAALDGLVLAVRRLGSTFAAPAGGGDAERSAAGRELGAAAGAWETAANRLRVICPDL